jgi:mRNA-degrading endonuclease RelE of RelBE toxin-antitoxin system
MSWTCRLAREAATQFRRLSRDRQEQLCLALDALEEDPARGGVRPMKAGRFKGSLRKRVERYRIIFSLDPSSRSVEIAAILTRGKRA